MKRFFNCSRDDVEKEGYIIDHKRISEYGTVPVGAVGTYKPHPYDTFNKFYIFAN